MGGFSSDEFAEFNGLLASVVERGLGLETAVDLLVEQARSRKVRDALHRVSANLRDGASLPQALEAAPELFPDEYRALVTTGAETRHLAEALRSAEHYHSMRAQMLRHLRHLATYLGAGFAVVLAVLYLIASLGQYMSTMFDQLGMSNLPVATDIVLTLTRHGWAMFAALVLPPVLVVAAYHLALRFKATARFIYWIPIWGRIRKSHDLAMICTVLSLRLRAGLPLADGVSSASRSLANRHARAVVDSVRGRIEQGEALSSALFYRRYFPRTLTWAVSLGETRGDLPGVFDQFGRIYWTNLERNFEMLHSFLTPLGILVLGNVVLSVIVSILLPIFQVTSHLSGP